MSQLTDLIDGYTADLQGLGVDVNADLLDAIARGQGPSIYDADGSLVSLTDKEEVARVKTNFLGGKLGKNDDAANDAAIAAVAAKYDSKRRKRVVFYYLLCEHFGVTSL